ncbi:MAG: hypothetical protein HN763_10585, partial [Opitutales bacterium]|nr:hypothetical protein [Opitutales bacterium]
AFSAEDTEQKMAREFIVDALEFEKVSTDVFESPDSCRSALEALTPNPDHMFWFEYNFLYVLAADGKAEKASLGDHSAAGYRQRERFYTISDEGQLRFARRVAEYIVFLARNTGLASTETCDAAKDRLENYTSWEGFLKEIAG